MMIATGVLVLLALAFGLIDARSSHNRWRIGVAACSLAAGVLLTIMARKELSPSLGLNIGSLSGAAEAVIIAAVLFVACYGLAMLVGGFIMPIKKGEKYQNSLLRLVAYILCAVAGAGAIGYFLFVAGQTLVKGGPGGISPWIAAAGGAYLLIGIGGIAQWNGRRKRISLEKAARQDKKPQAL